MNNSQITKAYLGSTSVVEGRKGTQLVLAPNGNALWYTANQRPSLDLRFAESKSLVDATTGQNLVTFTRASDGTYVGSDGVIKTATTNLLLRSEEFDSGSWSKPNITVTADQALAPNGTLTADRITDSVDATAVIHSATTSNQSFVSGLAYTASVYAKADTLAGVQIVLPSAGFTSNISARFNLSTGTVAAVDAGGTALIQALPDGWYRCVLTATATATASSLTTVQFRVGTTSTAFYQGNGTGTMFFWGAQLEQSSTVGEYIPTTSTINSAPRFDHNPTTGESLGLLVEEQRTNSIRNNTMVGAVAGTPGTLPTNWSISSTVNGLTRTIENVGIVNGINYIDVRFAGTATATTSLNYLNDSSTVISALNGQAWTFSAWASYTKNSGSDPALRLEIDERDSSGNFLAATQTSITPSQTLARYSTTRTNNNALTAFELAYIQATCLNGQSYDFTLRIGMPQLEQGAFATSVIPTSTVAVTRSADVASITGTNFSSWYNALTGTLFTDASIGYTVPGTLFPLVGSLNDGTTANRMENGFLTSTLGGFEVMTGGVTQAALYPSNSALSRKLAGAYSTNDFAASVNGGTTLTNVAGSVPVVDRLFIGSRTGSGTTNILSGTIRRLTYWPQRLSNSTLQALTQ